MDIIVWTKMSSFSGSALYHELKFEIDFTLYYSTSITKIII